MCPQCPCQGYLVIWKLDPLVLSSHLILYSIQHCGSLPPFGIFHFLDARTLHSPCLLFLCPFLIVPSQVAPPSLTIQGRSLLGLCPGPLLFSALDLGRLIHLEFQLLCLHRQPWNLYFSPEFNPELQICISKCLPDLLDIPQTCWVPQVPKFNYYFPSPKCIHLLVFCISANGLPSTQLPKGKPGYDNPCHSSFPTTICCVAAS